MISMISIIYIIFVILVLALLHYNQCDLFDFFVGDFRNTYNNLILANNFNNNYAELELNNNLNNMSNMVNGNNINNLNTLLLDREGKNSIDPIMFRDKINGIRDLYMNKPIVYYNDTGAKNVFAPQVTYEGSDIPVKYEFSMNTI